MRQGVAELLAIDGLSGAQVAAQIGMQLGMVYAAKSRVQKLLARVDTSRCR